MIRPTPQIEAAEEGSTSEPMGPNVGLYLRAIALLALECADKPWLWPVFIEIAKLVPETVIELARERRRIAA